MRNTGSVSSNPKRMRSKSTPRPVADSEFLLVGKMAMEQFYAVSAEQEEVEFHRTQSDSTITTMMTLAKIDTTVVVAVTKKKTEIKMKDEVELVSDQWSVGSLGQCAY